MIDLTAVAKYMTRLQKPIEYLSAASGVPEVVVNVILSGDVPEPSADTMQKLAFALHCSVGDITSDDAPRGRQIIQFNRVTPKGITNSVLFVAAKIEPDC